MSERRCLTPEEYATERRVSLKTVYRQIKAHTLPAERIGRQWRIWVSVRQSSPRST
jgi:excisionase family DNA binding protein